MAHGGPVLTAFRAGTSLYPLAGLLFKDVLPVVRFACLGIEAIPDVLIDRFLMTEILPSLTIQLPQDSVLSGREDQALSTIVDKNSLINNVEVQRFTGSMREVPG